MLYLWGYRWDGTMKKGFTLVELLAVITILGILATVSSVAVFRVLNNQKEALVNEQINFLADVSITAFLSGKAEKKMLSTCETLEIAKTNSSCYTKVQINSLINDGYFENRKDLCNKDKYVYIYKVKSGNSSSLIGEVEDGACSS